MIQDNQTIGKNETILVTGANGFIGSRVVERLLSTGFTDIRCFVRPSAVTTRINDLINNYSNANVRIIRGNLLSKNDCEAAAKDSRVIFHLAAGVSKSFADCVMNSVVTTRNLLEVIKDDKQFVRFLNVSSFAVYTGKGKRTGSILDETSEIEENSHLRGEAYTYGKIKQDEIVLRYHEKYKIPYVTVRPGVVYGPGKANIMGRIGIDTFGIFFHIGGSNRFPITYVENCADAIMLCGITKDIDGEIFNIVDDDIPTCRTFLRLYKKRVGSFPSIRVPYTLFYLLSFFWERYAEWSKGQLPPAFNRMRAAAHWKGRKFSNKKLKKLVGWQPAVSTKQGIENYFNYLTTEKKNA